MKLYILLDTSGSMEGAKIAALNDCMSNILVELQEKASNGSDIKLSVLSFAKEAKWMYENEININDFDWKELIAGGMTSLGKACLMLSDRLKEECQDQIVIVLLSDGCPTDDYDEGISELLRNERFKNAERFAIALGDNADIKSLTMFVTDTNNLYLENNADNLLNTLNTILETTNQTISSIDTISTDEDDEWS